MKTYHDKRGLPWTVSQLAERSRVAPEVARKRLKAGESVDEIIRTGPRRPGRPVSIRVEAFGRVWTLPEIASHIGAHPSTVVSRYRRGRRGADLFEPTPGPIRLSVEHAGRAWSTAEIARAAGITKSSARDRIDQYLNGRIPLARVFAPRAMPHAAAPPRQQEGDHATR